MAAREVGSDGRVALRDGRAGQGRARAKGSGRTGAAERSRGEGEEGEAGEEDRDHRAHPCPNTRHRAAKEEARETVRSKRKAEPASPARSNGPQPQRKDPL